MRHTMKWLICPCALAAMVAGITAPVTGRTGDPRISLVDRPAEHRVDVIIDGKPFTSYLYGLPFKPVLFPIRSAAGAVITRGYPLEPRAGERADHPHHVGHWFNYGDVNGFDFWGHSEETPPTSKPNMGTIVHKAVVRIAGGRDRGELTVRADWQIPDGSTLLQEETRFTFSGAPGGRTIDRVTIWTATARPVTFGDTKEGAFAIRVARALEQPSTEKAVIVGPDGTKGAPRQDNTGVTGKYLGSDGRTGDDVWGTSGPWMSLAGVVDGKPVTVAIFDHPSNHGYPNYWHARGYGLFAANPFGRKGYDPKQDPASFTMKPGEVVTFRHRILVSDRHLTAGDLKQEHAAFAGGSAR